MASDIAELERDASETRRRLDADLQELRRRATPGHLLDEAVDYLRHSGGADFARNLGEQVRNNPLPTVMIGVSMAWLMFAKSASRPLGVNSAALNANGALHDAADATRGAAARASEFVGNVADATNEYASAAADAGRGIAARAGEFASSVADSTSQYAEATADAAARLGNSVKSTYRRSIEGANQMTRRLGESSVGLGKTIQEQPLVLAGLGLVIGAAIGAALPLTEPENRIMGDTARDLADRGKKLLNDVQSAVSEPHRRENDVGGPEGLSPGEPIVSTDVTEHY